MSERLLYEIQGTSALAYPKPQGADKHVIDYDIARRSYESHRRLDAPETFGNQTISASPSVRRNAAHYAGAFQLTDTAYLRPAQRMTLQDLACESYDPYAPSTRVFSDTYASVKSGELSWYLLDGLNRGSLAGVDSGKTSFSEVLRFGAIGLSLVIALMFLFL